MQDWRPLLLAVQRDPWGIVAERIERVLDHLETYGTAAALRGWLRRCRAGSAGPARTLAELRREAGLSQRDLAARIGISQAQVARVETAALPTMRSLQSYLAALQMSPLALVASTRHGARVVRLAVDGTEQA